MSGNEQQIEFWNGPVAERWVKLQETLDRAMTDITAKALAFGRVKPGMRVVEIGCGCGSTALAMAEMVGPQGAVLGVDISVPMLAHAKARAARARSAAKFEQADASDYAFAPENDLVFSRFGVMFFADPPAAFANIKKALKPGGRLAFVCWRPFTENDWYSVPFAAARDLLPEQPPTDPFAPGPFAFADSERTKGILAQAGFENVAAEKFETHMILGADADAASALAMKTGPLARAAMQIEDDALKDKIRARAQDALAKYATPNGVIVPAACWLVEAEA